MRRAIQLLSISALIGACAQSEPQPTTEATQPPSEDRNSAAAAEREHRETMDRLNALIAEQQAMLEAEREQIRKMDREGIEREGEIREAIKSAEWQARVDALEESQLASREVEQEQVNRQRALQDLKLQLMQLQATIAKITNYLSSNAPNLSAQELAVRRDQLDRLERREQALIQRIEQLEDAR